MVRTVHMGAILMIDSGKVSDLMVIKRDIFERHEM